MSNNRPLILIVDDDADFREILSAKLEAEGFEVKTANDGDEGIKLAKELKPDLVLMDVMMPKVNGTEALLKIKDDPECREIKVLFLTALGDPRFDVQEIHRRLSKEVGAVGYLKKGEDLEYMVNYIKGILGR